MKYEELKEVSKAELLKQRGQLRERLFELRMKHSMGQLANPLEIRKTRRDLARYLTALNSKLKVE